MFGSSTERVLFLVLGFLIAAFFLWVSLAAVGALISSIRSVARGGEPTFHDAVAKGRSHAWRLILVHLATKAVTLTAGLFIAVTLATLMAERTALSAIMYLGVFTVFTAVAVLASVTGAYATVEVVAKDAEAGEALEDGLGVAVTHWLSSLETTILLAVAAVVLVVGSAIVVAMLAVPVLILIAVAAVVQAKALVAGLIALTGLTLFCAFILMVSFYGAFQAAVWTLLWHELGEGRGSPKLARWFHRLHSPKKK